MEYYGIPNSYVDFTYAGNTYQYTLNAILFHPVMPDGHLGYRDVLQFSFDWPANASTNQIDFFHTPAGNLGDYTLPGLSIGQYAEGGQFFFSDSLSGQNVSLFEPFLVPEPSTACLFGAALFALGLGKSVLSMLNPLGSRKQA